jgi:small subunit ribosomal protein S3
MGQKVRPLGFRIGITEDWRSRWFAPKGSYGEFLVEDQKIRRYVTGKLGFAAISKIEIERTREEVKIQIHTARPGLVIGPRGSEIDKLSGELEELTDRRVKVSVMEIKNPDINAQLVAERIAEQLRHRASFRRTMKQCCEGAMQSGAKGVKIQCSGRLGGREMARKETQILGSIPLATLQANVDYGYFPARTNYGTIGVKVWIYLGSYGDELPEGAPPSRRRGYGKRG